MLTPVLVATSLLAVLLVVALMREIRLRRAMQQLLFGLLTKKDHHDPIESPPPTSMGSTSPSPADRLQCR